MMLAAKVLTLRNIKALNLSKCKVRNKMQILLVFFISWFALSHCKFDWSAYWQVWLIVIGKRQSSFNADRVVDRGMTFYRPRLSITSNLIYLFIHSFLLPSATALSKAISLLNLQNFKTGLKTKIMVSKTTFLGTQHPDDLRWYTTHGKLNLTRLVASSQSVRILHLNICEQMSGMLCTCIGTWVVNVICASHCIWSTPLRFEFWHKLCYHWFVAAFGWLCSSMHLFHLHYCWNSLQ